MIFSSTQRLLFLYHFCVAFFLGYVPAWGQISDSSSHVVSSPIDVGIPSPAISELSPSAQWNGESIAVICPTKFRQALATWIEYRMHQGYKIYLLEEPKERQVIEDGPNGEKMKTIPFVTAEHIKLRIQALAQADETIKYLLIVGDATPDILSESTARSHIIPTRRIDARVISSFGREKNIASDNYYADLDEDDIPELAVGRLTADTPEELDTMIKKIMRYENQPDHGVWERRINLIAGVGGFSAIIDTVVETTTRHILSEMVPECFDLSLTQANWKSAYCPDPEMFRSVTVERFNEGCLFWVYIGHGYHKSLDYLRTPQGDYAIFAEGDTKYLAPRSGVPIMLFCACYTGALDAIEDSLAEEMLRAEQGPVAVIAASRTSMPYGMAVFGVELIDEALNGKSTHSLCNITVDGQALNTREVHNIGTIFLNAKRNMLLNGTMSASKSNIPHSSNILSKSVNAVSHTVGNSLATIKETGTTLTHRSSKNSETTPKSSDTTTDNKKQAIRNKIDSIARLTDPASSRLNDQLIDHIHLFHLFGDPLLQVPFPMQKNIEIKPTIQAGKTLTIVGNSQYDGPVLAEIVRPRSRPVSPPTGRTPYKVTDTSKEEYMKTYLSVNNRAVCFGSGISKEGQFELRIDIPEQLEGEYVVRVFATSPHGSSIGSGTITITPTTVAKQTPSNTRGR